MKQERTRRRLELLVSAAADLLAEQGWSALTHRGLAARSGVPLASLTYYFDGVDDLVVQAAAELARRHLDRARDTVAAVPRRRASATRTTALVAEVLVGPDPSTHDLVAFYERYARAGSTPALRDLVTGWNAELLALVRNVLELTGHPLPPARARLLVAALDGMLVTAVAEGHPDPVSRSVRAAAALLDRSPGRAIGSRPRLTGGSTSPR